MENNLRKNAGIALASDLFEVWKPYFATETFFNAIEMKRWLGECIKVGSIGGYRNLEWKEYKAVFDVVKNDKNVFHCGIDFGQQAIHVLLEPGNVHSLYYRNPWVEE